MITLTCKDRSDGIGAQVCGIISVMVLAESFNMKYAYTPLTHVAHYPYPYPNERELRIWKNRWEEMFNLRKPYTDIELAQGVREFIDYRRLPGFFNKIYNSSIVTHSLTRTIPMVYGMREAHNILSKYQNTETLSQGWKKVIEKIRNTYNRSRSDTPHFIKTCKHEGCDNTKITNIAVHIRRGDSVNTERRFVNHDYFVNVINSLLKKYNASSSNSHSHSHSHSHSRSHSHIHIHIYSEGVIDDFKEFKQFDNCYFHLNDDHFDTIHHFICSDIFVMSKSTFSYLGALYNDKGIIVYKPFWLLPPKPLEDIWIDGGDNGIFN